MITARAMQAKVAEQKRVHPERYCPAVRCLWRTAGGYCPRHTPVELKPRPVQPGPEAA